jgi:hypothetical protein
MEQRVVKYKLERAKFKGEPMCGAVDHGIQNESAVLRHLIVKCSWCLEGTQKSYKKPVGGGVLYGKVDGIRRTTAKRTELIEIKSRMAKFKGIERWEMVQVQLYLYLTDLTTCLFVESCKERVRCYRIQKNEVYIKAVMGELRAMMEYAAEPDEYISIVDDDGMKTKARLIRISSEDDDSDSDSDSDSDIELPDLGAMLDDGDETSDGEDIEDD